MQFSEHLFISDAHIGAFSKEKESETEGNLIALIDYAIDNKAALYILGDFFDYWMEYPQGKFIPAIGEKILEKFEEYNSKVFPAIYVTGNHDNWTFGHFKTKGFDVEMESRVLTIDDKKVLIMHGDGKFGPRGDFLRPAFHRLLRSSHFIKLFQVLFPPQFGIWLMKKFSNLTRHRNHQNPKPLNDHAEMILRTNDIDMVLCGHDHLPRMETFSNGSYINLGTFFYHKTMVRYANNKFSLVKWHVESKEFVPYSGNI